MSSGQHVGFPGKCFKNVNFPSTNCNLVAAAADDNTETGRPRPHQGALRPEPQDGGAADGVVRRVHTVRAALVAGDAGEREGVVQVKAQARLFAHLDGAPRPHAARLQRTRAHQQGWL